MPPGTGRRLWLVALMAVITATAPISTQAKHKGRDFPYAYHEATSGLGMRAVCKPGPDGKDQVVVLEETEESQYLFQIATCFKGEVGFGFGAIDCNYRKLGSPPVFDPPDRAEDVYVWVNRVELHPAKHVPCGNWLDFARPYIVRGSNRTVLPVRSFVEGLGGNVEWEPTSRKVTLRMLKKTVALRIDDPVAIVDGTALMLDQPPVIRGDRTFVPLRFVMEAFGAKVEYHKPKNTAVVLIDLPGVACINRMYCNKLKRPDEHGVHL